MTQQEILDYNKRCAEFLGMYDYSKDNEFFEKSKYFYYPEKDKNPGSGYYTVLQKTGNEYKGIFNSDWNWIMEIVEAIEKVSDWSIECLHLENDKQFQVLIPLSNTNIVSLDKKEAVIQAINQFLIWYNENNNNRQSR